MSLNALYESLASGGAAGLQKTASRIPLEHRKLAAHYMDIGKGMARAQFMEMLKQAAEEGAPEGDPQAGPEAALEAGAPEGGQLSEEEELAKRKAEMLARLEAEEAAAAGAAEGGGMPPGGGIPQGGMPPGVG